MSGTERETRLLLYGAYGYTGRLTAELAAAKRLDVVLAGRNEDKESLFQLIMKGVGKYFASFCVCRSPVAP